MRFTGLGIPGAYIVAPEPIEDERGFFARTWCREDFASHGLVGEFSQCSTSFNRRRGTLRGMHYQAEPHAEIKLVRCVRGAIYDVVVDLRPDSHAYCRWEAVELTADNRLMLWIPEGLAHGFQTLEDESEIYYQISTPYSPQAARGVRWDDPAFGIAWPEADPRILSAKDRLYEDFRP